MAKYVHLFETVNEYNSARTHDNYVEPWLSYTKENSGLTYNKTEKEKLLETPFTFIAKENGTFKFNGITSANTLSYSLDNGETWVALAHNTNTPTVNSGSSIMFKGECAPTYVSTTSYGIGNFISSGRFNVQGNIMSLLYGGNYQNQIDLTGKDWAFGYLFSANTNVVSAKNLQLPATTLSESCYRSMFRGCAGLTSAPELPATTLVDCCYLGMFYGCSSLTTIPELPATTLAFKCYRQIFAYCTSLTTIPFNYLPVTTLSESCYATMFSNCTSLTGVPSDLLPATTLAQDCYDGMFWKCSGLISVPELPATNLAEDCYLGMFNGCTSLTGVPSDLLPATTLAQGCYENMFSGCTALTVAPELPAKTLVTECYYKMFSGCTSLNYIKCLATDISATNCTTNWAAGVSSSGTFIKNPNMSSWTTGNNGIPANWTVQDAS